MTQHQPSPFAQTALGRPNKRQVAKAATRQRVLAAARDLFEAGTYEAATIRAIAKAAGMSTGAVFANFENKADVWTAVYGGPPPSPEIADEIARALGQLPDWTWSIGNAAGRVTVALFSPDWTPENRAGHEEVVQGDSPASALRAARLAALSRPTHAVRRVDDRAA